MRDIDRQKALEYTKVVLKLARETNKETDLEILAKVLLDSLEEIISQNLNRKLKNHFINEEGR